MEFNEYDFIEEVYSLQEIESVECDSSVAEEQGEYLLPFQKEDYLENDDAQVHINFIIRTCKLKTILICILVFLNN